MSAIFELDGERLVPTELATGPWDKRALHGGPTAAIAVRAAERHLADQRFAVSRLTLELLRPVPLAPLHTTAVTTRRGKKVTVVAVSVFAADTEVARAQTLAIRDAVVEVPPGVGQIPTGDPLNCYVTKPLGEWVAFHNSGVEMRFESGMFREIGPAVVWIRLLAPVVGGEETSPAMRAAATADFGNGVSSELSFETWRFINPDLTVHLARRPVGEWICLDARTVLGDEGRGMAESALADVEGVFGRSVQSLLIERG